MRSNSEVDQIVSAFLDVQELAPNASLSSIGSHVGITRTYLHNLANRKRQAINPGGKRSLASYYQEYVELGDLETAENLAHKVSLLKLAVGITQD